MNSVNRDGLEPNAVPKRPKPLARSQWFLIIMQLVTTVVIVVILIANQADQRARQKRIAHLEDQLKQLEEGLQKKGRPVERDGVSKPPQ
jgi:cell division protein FtsL